MLMQKVIQGRAIQRPLSQLCRYNALTPGASIIPTLGSPPHTFKNPVSLNKHKVPGRQLTVTACPHVLHTGALLAFPSPGKRLSDYDQLVIKIMLR